MKRGYLLEDVDGGKRPRERRGRKTTVNKRSHWEGKKRK